MTSTSLLPPFSSPATPFLLLHLFSICHPTFSTFEVKTLLRSSCMNDSGGRWRRRSLSDCCWPHPGGEDLAKPWILSANHTFTVEDHLPNQLLQKLQYRIACLLIMTMEHAGVQSCFSWEIYFYTFFINCLNHICLTRITSIVRFWLWSQYHIDSPLFFYILPQTTPSKCLSHVESMKEGRKGWALWNILGIGLETDECTDRPECSCYVWNFRVWQKQEIHLLHNCSVLTSRLFNNID